MIKKYFVFTVIYFLSFGLNLIVNRFVFQNLSELEYGKYSYFLNLLMIVAPILSLNVKDGVMRFFDYNNPSFWHAVFLLSCISFLLGTLFSFFFSLAFIPFFGLIFYNVILSIVRGREQLVQFNVQRILPSLILVILVYVYKPSKFDFLILLTGVSYLLSCVVYYIQNLSKINKKLLSPISRVKILAFSKEILTFSIPTIFTSLSLWAFNFFDQYIIEFYHGYEYLSDYAAAVRILNAYKVLLSIILVIFPVFYYKNYEKPELIKKLRLNILIAVLVVTIGGIVFKDALYLLFGAKAYLSKSFLLYYLIFAESMRFISTIYLTIFAYLKRNLITTYIYLVVTFVSLIVNFIIVPKFGDIGAAIVDLISSIILILITLFFSRKYEFK